MAHCDSPSGAECHPEDHSVAFSTNTGKNHKERGYFDLEYLAYTPHVDGLKKFDPAEDFAEPEPNSANEDDKAPTINSENFPPLEVEELLGNEKTLNSWVYVEDEDLDETLLDEMDDLLDSLANTPRGEPTALDNGGTGATASSSLVEIPENALMSTETPQDSQNSFSPPDITSDPTIVLGYAVMNEDNCYVVKSYQLYTVMPDYPAEDLTLEFPTAPWDSCPPLVNIPIRSVESELNMAKY